MFQPNCTSALLTINLAKAVSIEVKNIPVDKQSKKKTIDLKSAGG
jgi:hypothetical protein